MLFGVHNCKYFIRISAVLCLCNDSIVAKGVRPLLRFFDAVHIFFKIFIEKVTFINLYGIIQLSVNRHYIGY
jgi:hypothetical protein